MASGGHVWLPARVTPTTGGRPLDSKSRAKFESSLRAPFGAVRLHDDAHAARAASALGATAYTAGPHVVLGRGAPSLDSPPGQRLLAHELAHVEQQRRGLADPAVVHRQVAVPAPTSGVTPNNATTFVLDPALAQTSPPGVTTHLRVVDPWAPAGAPSDRYVAIEHRVRSVTSIRVYGVPLVELFDNPAEASTTDVAATPRVAPQVVVGQHVWTNRGEFTVLGTDGSLAFSNSSVPEATAAASVLLVRTEAPTILIDLGQQGGSPDNRAGLGSQVAHQLLQEMPSGQIDEGVLMPSAPSGHNLPQIALTFAVGTVRASPEQFLDARVRESVDAVVRAQATYREELARQLRNTMASSRAEWESHEPIAPNEALRQKRWDDHLDQVVASTLGLIPPTVARYTQPSGAAISLPQDAGGPAVAAGVATQAVGGPSTQGLIADRTTAPWTNADDELIVVVGGDGLHVISSSGLLLRPAPGTPTSTTVPELQTTGPTGPTPVGARPPTQWVAAAAVGHAGQTLVRTGLGPGVLIDAGAKEAFLPDRAITQMIGELGLTSIDAIMVTHPHADHVRALLDVIVTHGIRADRFITARTWSRFGPLNAAIGALRTTTDPRLVALGYGVQSGTGAPWEPGIAAGQPGVAHATLRVAGGQVEIFTDPAAHDRIRGPIARGERVSADRIDASSLFYVMGNETSSHRVAVLGDLRGTDILRFARLPGDTFARALTGVRVIVGFGHHLGPAAGTSVADAEGYELLFRETLLRNGELTIVVQSSADEVAGPNPLLDFARAMGARVVFAGEPGSAGGGAVLRSDLSVGTYGTGVQQFPGDSRVQAALERLQMLREADRVLAADADLGPRQLRLTQTAAQIRAQLAPEISRLQTLLQDLLGRRAADLLDARARDVAASTKASFRAARSTSGLTPDQILAQLDQKGPFETSLHEEVIRGLRQAVRHASPLAVEAELLSTPRGVADAIARLSDEQRTTLERQYREIRELAAEFNEGRVPPEQHLDVLHRIETLRSGLQQAVAAAPAEAREPLDGEIRRLTGVVDKLMANVEVRTVTGRDTAGNVTQTEIRTLRPPTDSVDRAFGRVGQVFGVLMMIHSVQGLTATGAGLAAGQVSVPQAAFQVAQAGYSMHMGVRMLRLEAVHPAEFVAVAVLEVGAILTNPNLTQEERDYQLATVAIDQLCMAVGMAIMGAGSAIPVPTAKAITMSLGLAVTLFGARVLGWLGLDEWLVRVTSFAPDEVTHVSQRIEVTLREYEAIVGAMDLARRSDEQLRALGATDPAALREQAEAARATHTERAHAKEAELVALFREAYEVAATSFAGLRYLDAAAARFARLRYAALPADSARAAIQQAFTDMDPQNAELRNATAASVRAMRQWPKLDTGLNDLRDALSATPVDWAKVFEYLGKVEQMIDNARYRVDPSGASYRPAAMITPGSPAHAEYVMQLAARERTLGERLAQVATASGTPGVLPPFPSVTDYGSDPAAAVSLVQSLRTAYDERINEAATALPELARADTWADSVTLMRQLEEAHHDRAELFNRLRAAEVALQLAIGQARTALALRPGTPALADLVRRETSLAEQAIEARTQVHGLVLPDEVDATLARRRVTEDRTLAAQIDSSQPRAAARMPGAAGTTPLSEPEIIALHSTHLSDQGERMTSTEHQLARAWELISPMRSVTIGPGGDIDLNRLSRLARALLKPRSGTFWTYSSGTILDSADEIAVPSGPLVVVARVGADMLGRTGVFSGPASYTTVLPISEAAVDLLGTDVLHIRINDLVPASTNELTPAISPAPAPAPAPVPVPVTVH
jgi:hypothetical protein